MGTIRPIDMIQQLWEDAGEPSDLNPWLLAADPYTDLPDTGFDIDSRGIRYYLQQLSRAQMAISNWRKKSGYEVRFKKFITSKNIFCGLSDNTFDFRPYGSYGVSVPVDEMPTDLDTDDYDIFEGSYITVEGTDYPIISSEYDSSVDGGSCVFTFYETAEFDTSEDSYEGMLYMNKFRIKTDGVEYSDGFYCSVPTEVVEILKMYDGPTSDRMTRPADKDSLYNLPPTYGIPEQWYIIGDTLYFDTYLEEQRYFNIEYYRMPYILSADTLAELIALRFEIPDYFVEPIGLWIEWRQARRSQEWDKAYAIKRDLYDIIETMALENSLDFLRDESYGFYVQTEENT